MDTNGLQRFDYELLETLISPNASVIDLGCGKGELLAFLNVKKNIQGYGIEISADGVQEAIKKGLSVIQADIEETLSNYPEDNFDYAILSQTLQELRNPEKVIAAMVKISKRAIITFYNLAHISFRMKILIKGRFPASKDLPFNWMTSNIMFMSVADFKAFCDKAGYKIVSELYYSKRKIVKYLPNLRAQVCIFEIM